MKRSRKQNSPQPPKRSQRKSAKKAAKLTKEQRAHARGYDLGYERGYAAALNGEEKINRPPVFHETGTQPEFPSWDNDRA